MNAAIIYHPRSQRKLITGVYAQFNQLERNAQYALNALNAQYQDEQLAALCGK